MRWSRQRCVRRRSHQFGFACPCFARASTHAIVVFVFLKQRFVVIAQQFEFGSAELLEFEQQELSDVSVAGLFA